MKKKIQLLLKKYNDLPVQARAGFWFLVCTVIQRSITIITTPIFTRLLTNAEYGEYGVFISWMGILSCFVTMYIFSSIYPQAIVKYNDKRDVYSSGMQGFTVTLVIFWCVMYYLGKQFWNGLFSMDTWEMTAMFVVMWGNAAFGFWSAEQRNDYKYKILIIVTLAEAILQPVLSIVLLLRTENKVDGLVCGIAIANIVCYFPLFIAQMRKGKKFFSGDVWKYSLKLGIPLIPHYLSSVVLNSSDRIMIQRLVGEGPAGIYNLAYTVSICGTLINQAVLQTIQPWVYQKIKEGKYYDIKKTAYSALVVIGCVNILVILIAPELIRVFGPDSYYEAIWVMPPVSLSVYFMFMYNLFSYFEFYYEKPMYVSAATFIGAGLNVILNYIFIQKFGYVAAGYTTLICYFAFAVAHYCFMRIICRKEINGAKIYDLRVIAAISLAVVSAGFLVMLTYNNTYIRYALFFAVILVCVIKRKTLLNYVMHMMSKKRDNNRCKR